MPSKTVVVMVPLSQRNTLRTQLGAGDFEWSDAPHASFRIKGEGCVATLYKSGKFVIQGQNPEFLLERYTDLSVPEPEPEDMTDLPDFDGAMIGSDETGKGDYFGPLVVAAVRLEPDMAERLRELGVADSKKLTDKRALALGAMLREAVPFSLQRLMPTEYNAAYSRYGNLNPLLADLHARAIADVAEPGDLVLVDQFARADVMTKALSSVDVDVDLRQATRAERNVAVAAASVLARQEFLASMKELGDECGIELPKGAGDLVDRAGRKILSQLGRDTLGTVAKLHFKNTAKIEQS